MPKPLNYTDNQSFVKFCPSYCDKIKCLNITRLCNDDDDDDDDASDDVFSVK